MTLPVEACVEQTAQHRYERLADEVTSVASHELRGPLRSISSLVEWISEDLGEEVPDRVAANLARVRSRVERLEGVIDALADFAAAGRATPESTPLKPAAVIHAALREVAPPESFAITVGGSAGPLIASRRPLQAVLRALIINSVQHHDRPEGAIEVMARDTAEGCLFTVRDDGPGVPEHAVGRLFRMFQTLSTSEGTGVGLAMARRIAEAHGGSLEHVATDRAGATFQLLWPRSPALGHG